VSTIARFTATASIAAAVLSLAAAVLAVLTWGDGNPQPWAFVSIGSCLLGSTTALWAVLASALVAERVPRDSPNPKLAVSGLVTNAVIVFAWLYLSLGVET
jgi:hypothetical protein